MSNCTQLQTGGSGGYQERAHWNNYKVTNLGTAAKTQNYREHFPVPVPARRQEFNSGKRVFSINSLVLFQFVFVHSQQTQSCRNGEKKAKECIRLKHCPYNTCTNECPMKAWIQVMAAIKGNVISVLITFRCSVQIFWNYISSPYRRYFYTSIFLYFLTIILTQLRQLLPNLKVASSSRFIPSTLLLTFDF